MVRHIVFFKLNENTPANKEALREKLLTLKPHIGELKALEVGINFSESERAYDLALVSDFEDEAALKRYATHPYHLDVIAYIKEVCSDTKVVDYRY
ncbi:MAG: stress responsive protein [Campylobacteraceae bacterium 4484_4]|nr:MAG: stress responsive protein [Campylobacteraceae bacterium 4484_4]